MSNLGAGRSRQALSVALSAIMIVSVIAVGGVTFVGDATAQSTLTVDATNGSDDGSSPYKTIQAAVDAANSGDTIQVEDGTYDESVAISTSGVTLESVNGSDSTTIRLDEASSTPVVQIEASTVTVDGFSIERLNGDAFAQGVSIRATDGVTISNNDITQTGGSQPQQGILITDNRGDQGTNTNTVVDNNEISDFDHGVAISTQDTNTGGISGASITNNILSNNVIGVKFSDFGDTGETLNADISDNDINNNQDGVRVLDDTAGPAGTNPSGVATLDSVTVNDNDLSGNSNSGVTNDGTGDTLDATDNWWGSAKPDFDTQVNDLSKVTVAPWLDAVDGSSTGVFNVDQSVYNATIQDAVDNANADETIEVPPGTYNESVSISTTGLTLTSTDGADATTIRLDEASSTPVVQIEASTVTVDDFSIERLNGDAFAQGVSIRATDGVTISNNDITQSSGSQPQQGILITDNRGDQGTNTNTTIDNNEVTDFDHGVAISTQDTNTGGISDASITANTLEDNVIGVKFSDFGDTGETLNADISDNDINSNQDGVRVLDDTTGPAGTTPSGVATLGSVTVNDNDLSGNSNTGVTNNGTGDTLDATSNWWGSAKPDFDAQVNDLSKVTVAPWLDSVDGSQTGVFNVDQGVYNATIQDAVDNANADETIEVPPGTYNESVSISTTGLTLTSTDGSDATTIRLDEASSTPVVQIEASTVTVDDFSLERINGQGFAQGVSVRATDGVTISNNDITQSGGAQPQQGILITDNRGDQVTNTNTVVDNNEISDFDHGVAISTQDTNVGGISGASITDNTLDNNIIGVKFSDFADTGETLNADISNNDINSNQDGVRVLDDTAGPAGVNPSGVATLASVTVNDNDLSGNSNSGVTNDGTGDTLDATDNWWGASSGPSGDGSGTGTSVSGDIDFTPFYTDSARTSLSKSVGSGSVDANGTAQADLSAEIGGIEEAEVTFGSSSSASSVTVVESDRPTGGAPEPTEEQAESVSVYTDISADQVVNEDVTVALTVNASAVDDIDQTRLLHYVNGDWTQLETDAQRTDNGNVRLEATASSLSPFAVVQVADEGEDSTDDTSSGSNRGSGSLVAGVDSVDQRISMGEISNVRAVFSGPTTGFVSISSVNGFPSDAPTPSGSVIATVDISPPDDVADSSGTVELTVSRAAIEDADADPSDLRIVRYDETTGELDSLNTEVASETDNAVVVTAETPGFSVFGVVAEDMQATATTTQTPTATPPQTPTATSTQTPTATSTQTPTATSTQTPMATSTEGSGPGFGVVVAVLTLIASTLLATRYKR